MSFLTTVFFFAGPAPGAFLVGCCCFPFARGTGFGLSSLKSAARDKALALTDSTSELRRVRVSWEEDIERDLLVVSARMAERSRRRSSRSVSATDRSHDATSRALDALVSSLPFCSRNAPIFGPSAASLESLFSIPSLRASLLAMKWERSLSASISWRDRAKAEAATK